MQSQFARESFEFGRWIPSIIFRSALDVCLFLFLVCLFLFSSLATRPCLYCIWVSFGAPQLYSREGNKQYVKYPIHESGCAARSYFRDHCCGQLQDPARLRNKIDGQEGIVG